ncbi:unnamed protein product [Rotaria socialis]|uniref:ADP ribosyltransferase domain-containing protein n=3 Tax=Rotaria TaxID=231623 RepID=A0A817ZYX6_9BILA|nr:unnamed protein product [Rotaria socialis]CAF3397755.1 unnamed protein product [Rotaria socialis]CAF3722536.1 unnamed protein product [Rotaria socialis]CAF4506473.1 unnamed protein product [Rotaria socialis]CAF4609238.1 unnamed protein product [Rotaria socialis]
MSTGDKHQDAKKHEKSVCYENSLLIWVASASESVNQYQTNIRELINAHFYSDILQCLDYIKSVVDEKMLIIIAPECAEKIICAVHLRPTVSAFIIFDPNRQGNFESSRILAYSKLIGIFTDIESLHSSIRFVMQHIEKQALAFSLFSQDKQRSARDLSKESAYFLWYQLLIHVLKQMSPDEQAKNEMLEKCTDYYQNDKVELKNIELFRTTYTCNQAIAFFTNETFLYKLVNKALRTENIELLYAFRFYIIDLCSELKRESEKMIGQGVQTLYRGQQIGIRELENLKRNIGTLISPNGFMSTSRTKQKALRFARSGAEHDGTCSVLYEIQVDPARLKSVTFADISGMSRIQEEDEVLFNLGAIFHIDNVGIYDESLSIMKISMTATDDGKYKVDDYLKMQESLMEEYTPSIFFGRLLWNELGRLDQATAYFHLLLKSDYNDTASVLNNLGIVQALKGDFAVALDNCVRALEMRSKNLLKNHPHIATSLHNIGAIYSARSDYVNAIDFYEQALAIRNEIYPTDNVNKATTMANLGATFKLQGDFSRARTLVQSALEMRRRLLPEPHPQIASCLWHLGNIAEAQSDYLTALSFDQCAFDMDELVLPADHNELSKDLNILMRVYKASGDIKGAINLCEIQLAKQRSIFGTNHPRIARTLMTMGHLFEADFEQRISYYKQALEVDPNSIDCLKWLGASAYGYEKLDESLLYWNRALDIALRDYSSTHTDIAQLYSFIGNAYYDAQNYEEALKVYNESFKIWKVNDDEDQCKDVQKCIFKTEVRLKLNRHKKESSFEAHDTNAVSNNKTLSCTIQ